MFIIGYVRVSSEEQVAGYSIEAQIEAIRRWAEAGGHQLRVILVEPGLSAKSDDRPVFQQAIKMVLAGQADTLVVHKFDRFSRNVLDSRLYKQMLRSNGNDILSVSEPIDGGPAGQLMEGVLELFAEYYIVNLGAEVRKGLLAKARAGEWPGRDAPAGYRRVRDGRANWIEVSEMGAMIGSAFKEFSGGNYTLQSWAAEAYRRGYRGQRSGKKIFPSTWHKIFRNRFYLGVIVWNGQAFEGRHHPLVDAVTFAKVQAILGRSGNGQERRRHRYLLKGLLFSTVHQAPMTGNTVINRHGKPFCYYRSTNHEFSEHNVPCRKLEDQIAHYLYSVRAFDVDTSDMFGLALAVSPSVGAVFEALTTFEEKRQLLELVFAPGGAILVGHDGFEGAGLNPGFEFFQLGSASTNNNHSCIIYAALLPSPISDEPVNRLDLQAFFVPEIVSETRF